jgi:hypothetical protein
MVTIENYNGGTQTSMIGMYVIPQNKMHKVMTGSFLPPPLPNGLYVNKK